MNNLTCFYLILTNVLSKHTTYTLVSLCTGHWYFTMANKEMSVITRTLHIDLTLRSKTSRPIYVTLNQCKIDLSWFWRSSFHPEITNWRSRHLRLFFLSCWIIYEYLLATKAFLLVRDQFCLTSSVHSFLLQYAIVYVLNFLFILIVPLSTNCLTVVPLNISFPFCEIWKTLFFMSDHSYNSYIGSKAQRFFLNILIALLMHWLHWLH